VKKNQTVLCNHVFDVRKNKRFFWQKTRHICPLAYGYSWAISVTASLLILEIKVSSRARIGGACEADADFLQRFWKISYLCFQTVVAPPTPSIPRRHPPPPMPDIETAQSSVFLFFPPLQLKCFKCRSLDSNKSCTPLFSDWHSYKKAPSPYLFLQLCAIYIQIKPKSNPSKKSPLSP
jgi:hypothetical protein